MKERKFKQDWVTETRTDEKTGKEKRVPVYRGPLFENPAGGGKRELILRALPPWAGFLLLLLLYFRLDFPGARVLYVFLPAALSLFPCLYWAMGLWTLFRAPRRMTRVQKETGVGRVLRSAAGCAVLILAALAGVLVFLFSGGDAAREWPGALMLLAAGALAFGTAAYFRGIFRRLEEKSA